MKNLLIKSIVVFSCYFMIVNPPNDLYSQTWVPTGATWNYDYGPDMGGGRGVVILEYAGDEMVQSKMCKRLDAQLTWAYVFNPSDTSSGAYSTHYIYENDDTVFYYSGFDSSFYVLYNFNAQVGDSWQFPVQDCDSLINITVDSVGTTVINSDTLRTMQVTLKQYWAPLDQSMYTESKTIIEKIGVLDAYFILAHNKQCVTDISSPSHLLCYEDDAFPTYQTDSFIPCYYRFVSIEDQVKKHIKTYPNPAQSTWYIQNEKPGILELFSLPGKKILSRQIQSGTEQINISQFAEGIYFYRISSENGEVMKSGKLVKQ